MNRSMLALAFLSACTPQPQTPEYTNPNWPIIAANTAFYSALSRHNVVALTKQYAHEDYVVLISPGMISPIVGWPAVEQWVKAIGNQTYTEDPIVLQVHVYGDTGWVAGREHVVGTLNGAPIDASLSFSNIFENHDGHWLMVLHHVQ